MFHWLCSIQTCCVIFVELGEVPNDHVMVSADSVGWRTVSLPRLRKNIFNRQNETKWQSKKEGCNPSEKASKTGVERVMCQEENDRAHGGRKGKQAKWCSKVSREIGRRGDNGKSQRRQKRASGSKEMWSHARWLGTRWEGVDCRSKRVQEKHLITNTIDIPYINKKNKFECTNYLMYLYQYVAIWLKFIMFLKTSLSIPEKETRFYFWNQHTAPWQVHKVAVNNLCVNVTAISLKSNNTTSENA